MAAAARRKLVLLSVLLSFFIGGAKAACSSGCNLALASYYVWDQSTLTFISEVMNTSIQTILDYNHQISNPDSLQAYTRILVPFSRCDCINELEQLPCPQHSK
ncbi:hypothetical protein NE237_001639 [Protea cynaroides]|uniref:LysM domain-containing protein n=1 Tax=Protea cynaroides TaxID=273540 RepID=A0A9Q0KTH6_9MAGN|nr:hypothetical protein NE237_001639 [Protea cynaroides]